MSQLERGKDGKSKATSALRTAILQGDMVPGQRLVEAELAERFGVTRGSLRGAIDDLVADGLVERVHNRGASVRRVSKEQTMEILECREVLEALIANKAAERATDTDRARLRVHGDLLRQAVQEGDLEKYSSLGHELHTMLAEIAGQHTAADIISRLNAQIVRQQVRVTLRPSWRKVSLGQHLAIIEAVAGGDSASAERAMREHLANLITEMHEVS